MSIKLMSAIFETEFRDLPLPEPDESGKERHAKASSMKLVLLALADHANEEGETWPGYTRLELKTGLSRQGIADVISSLRYNGIISISELPSKSGTNFYTVNTTCFPKMTNDEDKRLLVKPLDQSSHLTSTSQATLPEVVKPLDLNHHITTKETPPQIVEIEKSANKTVDFILRSTLSPKAIQDAIKMHLKLTPNWEAKYNRQWMEWAVQNEVTPEQVECAANVWKMDKRFNWKMYDLKGIQEHWLELIESFTGNAEPRQPDTDGGYN